MNHTILMVENDSDDRLLTEEMFRSEGLTAKIDFIYSTVLNGYIKNLSYKPTLIILSLNAQANDLSELILCIRHSEICRSTPLIVLSDVVRPADIEKSYALGANSLIKKPDNYADTVFKIKAFVNYWFGTVELPV